MGHRLYFVYELEQNPDSKYDSLIWLTHGICSQIVAAGDLMDQHLLLQRTDNLLRSLRGLILQHSNNLRFGQGSILGQPAYDILFFLQQHSCFTFSQCAY